MTEVTVTDWRTQCPTCGRFLSSESFVGTSYTPYGPNFEYDGYTDFYDCPKDGQVAARMLPVRFTPVDQIEGD